MSIARNSLYGLAGNILPLVTAIATVPLFVDVVGAARYGALTISWLLLAYFGQTDFGIGRAVTQRVAAAAQSDPGRLSTVVWSGLVLIAGVSLVIGGLVYLAAGWYFDGYFEADAGLRRELLESVWIIALCAPVMAIAGIFGGTLVGLERFGVLSLGTCVSSISLQVFPLLVAIAVGPDLRWLVLASLASRLLLLAIVGIAAWRAALRGKPVQPSREEMRHLGQYGSWVMVTALVGPVMIYSDRVVIGATLGAAAVAAFVIPAMIAQRVVVGPAMLGQALFPRFAADEPGASLSRCRDYIAFVAQTFAPVAIGLICLAAPLLDAWLGSKLDPRSIAVGQIVMAGCWINATAQIAMGFVQARGDSRFPALLHVAETPLYLASLFGFAAWFGLAGMAAAYSLRCLVDAIALMWRSGTLDWNLMSRLIAPAALVCIALAAGPYLRGWVESLVAATVLCALSLVVLVWQMPPTLRAQLARLPLARRIPWFVRYGQVG